MSKVSLIIPVYNTEEYIEKCFSSVKEQTYKDIEIILVDDNSNKNCRLLLKELASKDPRIKLFHFDKRKGVGAARNFGIKQATGDFVYFLDSDDYIPSRTIEILVNNIKNNNLIHGRIRRTNFSNGFSIVFDGLFKVKSYKETKYNLIKNRSALNILFRMEFIKKHNLTFSEEVETYSDLCFVVPALMNVFQAPYVKEAIYFKRRRNDPISNPSLMQKDEEIKIKDFLYIYNLLKDKYKDKSISMYLDKQFLNFYRKNIVTFLKETDNVELIFDQLSKTSKRVNPAIIKSLVVKREMRLLQRKKLVKYKKRNSFHHLLRDIKIALKGRTKFYIFLYQKVFTKFKMDENMIFLESFLGKSYSDSPKYIYEHMIENNQEFKFVWSLNEKKEIPGNHIQVKRFSLRYFYYLAKAKYWVSNSRIPRYLNKREGNVYLQTWHGTPLKNLVFDMDEIHSANPNYKRNFYDQSRRWDYLSSPNQYSSDIFRRAFKFEKEMLEFGYPRNDILYKQDTEEGILSLKKKMDLPLDKKVILYAPTWRDDEFISSGKYKFELQLELDKLQAELGEDYIVLLRMHYFIASQLDITKYQGFAYNYSDYDDIAELYLVSDILITDYSSVFFDYANLKRPILFYTYDLEKYRDTLRGFYIDIESEVPGPLVKTTEDVINKVKNIDEVQEEYEEIYQEFYDRFCKWDDGNASEKTVERVFIN